MLRRRGSGFLRCRDRSGRLRSAGRSLQQLHRERQWADGVQRRHLRMQRYFVYWRYMLRRDYGCLRGRNHAGRLWNQWNLQCLQRHPAGVQRRPMRMQRCFVYWWTMLQRNYGWLCGRHRPVRLWNRWKLHQLRREQQWADGVLHRRVRMYRNTRYPGQL
jgi:hypothetical protein